MITAEFRLGGEIVSVMVEGNGLMFLDIGTGVATTLEGVRFSKAGVLKEHPDLKDEKDWKLIAIKRLKDHMKTKETEMEKIIYVKDELAKFGYEPLRYTRNGHRPQKFK